jgi:hypothetical protein
MGWMLIAEGGRAKDRMGARELAASDKLKKFEEKQKP